MSILKGLDRLSKKAAVKLPSAFQRISACAVRFGLAPIQSFDLLR